MEFEWLRDPNDGAARVKALRDCFAPSMFGHVEAMPTRQDAFVRGVSVAMKIFGRLKTAEIDVTKIAPGHGLGHMMRDYVNALRLYLKLDAPPAHVFIGFLGGVFHDIGCALVPRYEESTRLVRHAEAGALCMFDLLQADNCGLNQSEILLLCYAIAAHTHYLSPQKIKLVGGEEKEILPYVDLDESGAPIIGVWGARWVDRLDTNGPAFVGRHYLTLVETHVDFTGKEHYVVEYVNHMRPLLRDKPEKPQTMAEHLRMFANSQTNDSPYGKWDFGRMIEIRDNYREKLLKIVAATQSEARFPPEEIVLTQRCWTQFLWRNVEPTPLGMKAAEELSGRFERLDDTTKQAWTCAFNVCMLNYAKWAEVVEISFGIASRAWVVDPALPCNVLEMIRPHELWLQG
jgi:hypothetical protein